MLAIFPSDNLLAKLCDEQKYFKEIERFSNIIPYCKLETNLETLTEPSFEIGKAEIDGNKVIKKCFAVNRNKKICIGNFVLGAFKQKDKEKIRILIKKNCFGTLSFKTFYTCSLIIKRSEDRNLYCWYIKNIKWYKGKKKPCDRSTE